MEGLINGVHTPENFPKVAFRKVFESSSVFKICRQLSKSFLVYASVSKNFPKVLCKSSARSNFRKVFETFKNFLKVAFRYHTPENFPTFFAEIYFDKKCRKVFWCMDNIRKAEKNVILTYKNTRNYA